MNVLGKLGAMHQVLAAREYDVRPLIAMPPADPRQVAELESAVGTRLPGTIRDVLLQVSACVEFRWFAGDRKFAPPFRQNFSGDLHWSVDLTAQVEADRKSWCSGVFSDREDPYDAVRHNKLAFYEIGNGGDAGQFLAALRAFGSRAIGIGEFSAIFYPLLPAWNEQDATQRALVLLLGELDQATTREDQDEIIGRLRDTALAASQET